jgi:probable phosphoglycerate mutase
MNGTKLLLIRHGETEWNAAGRIQGHIDTPLSAHGVWQAERLAQALAAEPIGAIFCSDLQRAAQTAAPLAKLMNLPIISDTRLRERNYGSFEGHTRAEIEARQPAEFARWMGRDPDFAPPGGESTRTFARRVQAALVAAATAVQALTVPTGGGRAATVVAVAHGGILDVAYRLANGIDWRLPRRHELLNASINRLTITLTPFALRMDGWADVAHLAESDDDVLS